MAEPRTRTVVQAPRFGRSKKRLPAAAQLQIDEAVKGLLADPLSGEPKTGALKGVKVIKFKVGPQQLLLAYQFDAKRQHDRGPGRGAARNFYRELQKYLDAR